jgi:hypothetical protein
MTNIQLNSIIKELLKEDDQNYMSVKALKSMLKNALEKLDSKKDSEALSKKEVDKILSKILVKN